MSVERKLFIDRNREALLQLHRDLCHIPAPSHHEEARAEFCKHWLEQEGAKGVYIDEALNVIFPINCEGRDEITVIAAHTDTVFPDMEPMAFEEDDEKIYCPGAGDDTASLAVMMMMAKYMVEYQLAPKKGMLIVCNSCEEGLGNLKGTRQLMKDYAGRIKQFITFDSSIGNLCNRCVGSHRYKVCVKTEGGHSFGKFGNANAIAELAKIIAKIYEISVPVIGDSKTTYNVGIIEGGTSVNTIAQCATMLCEYRSDNVDCLETMRQELEQIFKEAVSDKVEVDIEIVGERPCGIALDPVKAAELIAVCKEVTEEVSGKEVVFHSGSTDCNIPLSLGIPAICMGVYRGAGTHTREEWIEKASMKEGLEIALRLAEKLL
ncbi:MAG: M20/M25/M40 family metallo-hydrolase [Lachnospiraceae bacterium]|nr:M20/M25/M40 family metallo-hydrolase [Lachnospiraceae bacterium]